MKYNDDGTWKDIQVKVANAIQNEYGESNNDGYSQNYLNDKVVNVGASLDSRSRVNVLNGKNKVQLNNIYMQYAINDVNGVLTPNSTTRVCIFQVKVKPNTQYTISCASGYLLGNIFQYNESKTFTTKVESGYARSKQYTSNSTTHYISFVLRNSDNTTIPTSEISNIKVQVEEGNTETTYEPYIVPSIYVDNDEIYSKPVVLWQNSSPTSSFASGNISLSEALTNFSYYEINYKLSASSNVYISTGKLPVGSIAYLQVASNNNMRRYAEPNSAGTQILIGNGEVISTYGSSATNDNSRVIPYQVIGYK